MVSFGTQRERTLLNEVVYGLPEWNREKIKTARLVANPGCYPTSAILALAPFIAKSAIKAHSIIVDSASGVSGAGTRQLWRRHAFPRIPSAISKLTTLDCTVTRPKSSRRLNDVSPNPDDPEARALITFTAHLLPVARGILSTCYAAPMNEMTSEDGAPRF